MGDYVYFYVKLESRLKKSSERANHLNEPSLVCVSSCVDFLLSLWLRKICTRESFFNFLFGSQSKLNRRNGFKKRESVFFI